MNIKLYSYIGTFLLFISIFGSVHSTKAEQIPTDTATYTLTLKKDMMSKAGKSVPAMTVNGGIPGPTLTFQEGGYAVIYVKNEMDVETSVHWHGILLPNFYDGVPYLTTPPIMPGETQKYEFPLKQAGTYWYHSHTMLQEQSGVYGSIVIEPKENTLDYDDDLVILLSDWTNQKPMNVMRNLKRGNEWYNIKKGTATPLNQVIRRGGFGAQLNFWKQRMEGADIADIYYNAFLNNGQETTEYPEFKPGEKVRVRFINGAASSQFWLTFGGNDPLLVAADGLDVEPIEHNKTFIAIAETYDFIVTIPDSGKIEIRATVQDGSGQTSTYLGTGEVLAAPNVMRPDKIGMMMEMAEMDMKMGAPAMKYKPSEEEPKEMMDKWGMKMDHDMNMDEMDHSKMDHTETEMDHSKMDHSKMKMEEKSAADSSGKNTMEGMDHSKMDHSQPMDQPMEMEASMDQMPGMDMFAEYNYDYLKSPEKTSFPENEPVNEVLLNLTGNMWRYIWSMNGVPLTEADKIKIEGGKVTRITLNNLTMMHHPMHLHGHFFRVINDKGEYSPLKHTVNVPPMQKITIEFEGTEDGDWFFHCHVLYHMMGGMARIFSYETPRDPRLKNFPLKKLINESDEYFNWGTAEIASHMTELNLVSSNIRNQFNLNLEYGYNQNFEGEVTYERYLYDYFRVFAGVNVENELPESLDEINTTAIVGIRFLTPYLFNLDVRLDHKLRPEFRIDREIMIFPKTSIFGSYEYQMDFGWTDSLPESGANSNYRGETTWSAGVEYIFSRNFSVMGSYDNRFGAGGGLTILF
ncbi:multicopper oxidase domain-containing protein [uncultured Algoriphagus sp.]|uniref:multicopper oxidase domain-containing protein n=1 Tax=uncultured Algoriphagus sp. TaxID=417365 RepID=UPI0030EDB74F